jgi:DNA polymerase-4
MDRTIIHLNVADFAAAVERRLDSALRDRPVVIAPPAGARAPVFDMSEEAFREGVRKGMPLAEALRRCPAARHLPPRFERYERAMAALLKEADPWSPRVEAGPADGHLFLDMTGSSRLFGPPVDVAWRLRTSLREILDVPPAWSVAPNRLTAKVATRLAKPSGEYVVGAGEEAEALAPVPLPLVPGIEAAERTTLADLNLRRAGQVAALEPSALAVVLGRRARFVHEAVRGVDPSPVQSAKDISPRIRREHLFGRDTADPGRLRAGLWQMCEAAGTALRKSRMAAGKATVTVEFTDCMRTVRQRRIFPATADDLRLFDAAETGLRPAWGRRVRVRRLTLVCDRLVFPPVQLDLFPDESAESARRAALLHALDEIRGRFGPAAVRIGRGVAA